MDGAIAVAQMLGRVLPSQRLGMHLEARQPSDRIVVMPSMACT